MRAGGVRPGSQCLLASLEGDLSGQACCPCLQEFQEGPWSQQNLDPSACMLIPVTGPRGGAVVVGESTICYFHDSQPMRACQIDSTLIRVGVRFSHCCCVLSKQAAGLLNSSPAPVRVTDCCRGISAAEGCWQPRYVAKVHFGGLWPGQCVLAKGVTPSYGCCGLHAGPMHACQLNVTIKGVCAFGKPWRDLSSQTPLFHEAPSACHFDATVTRVSHCAGALQQIGLHHPMAWGLRH